MNEQLWTNDRIKTLLDNYDNDWHERASLYRCADWLEQVRDEYEALLTYARATDAAKDTRIAELEAKLRTMSELEEQHLLCIDELQTQIVTLQIDVDDWKAIAGASENIANIAVQRYKDASGTAQS